MAKDKTTISLNRQEAMILLEAIESLSISRSKEGVATVVNIASILDASYVGDKVFLACGRLGLEKEASDLVLRKRKEA